ncbi:conserved hypothetical protein [Treponema primitia ZAS-2]|uniref:FecR protein domain-containing protein n=1 Tax=Treponema primitia (strain ATCC BAA-887 / DSM 12427 / ZAS-2) TaxID=545694 RepID=F5YHE4_TREPZ|nr:FecR domain-containing protein [Treponema primitia]AEF86499.1 conserved hypothetical protein [Treponema primitia ZAS-2]
MKKYPASLLFIWVLAVPSMGLWAQNGAVSKARETTSQAAFIQEISGKVETKAPGSDWVSAVEGQMIENGTMISTGFKGVALIALGNSVLTVRPLTRLTLREIRENAGNEQVRLDMETGRIRADVSPPAGGRTDFMVRSPITTASVRGTSFEFDGTILIVAQGQVRFTGGDSTSVYVSAGHRVTINSMSGEPILVAEMIREEMKPDLPAGMSAAARGKEINPWKGTDLSAEGTVYVGTKWVE